MKERSFKVLEVSHIGIVAKDSRKFCEFFDKNLGFGDPYTEDVLEQSTRVNMFGFKKNSSSRIELLDALNESGPIQKYREKFQSGIHHIALKVDSILKAVEQLKNEGIEFTSEQPGKGADNSLTIFIHPRSTGGVLIELIEEH